MRIFLAGGESRHWIHDSLLEDVKKNEKCKSLSQGSKENGKDLWSMQLYLAGVWPWRNGGV